MTRGLFATMLERADTQEAIGLNRSCLRSTRPVNYQYNIADADGNVLHPDKSAFTPGAVHVRDLQATILHLLGVDHERLNYL